MLKKAEEKEGRASPQTRAAEDFEARMRPAASPAPVPIFKPTEPVQDTPVAVRQPKRLPTPEEMFGIVPQQRPSNAMSTVSPAVAPVQGGIIHNRTILPMPVRRGGVKIDRQCERNLKEILDELDTGDDDEVDTLTKGFANVHIGVPRSVKTGNNLWGLGGDLKRKRLGLERRPWGI